MVTYADAGGNLRVTRAVENVSSGYARREQRAANNLIPIKAESGLNQEARGCEPAVLKIGAGLGVVCGGGAAASKELGITSFREAGGICWRTVAVSGNWRPLKELIIGEAVEICAEYQIVAAMPLARDV